MAEDPEGKPAGQGDCEQGMTDTTNIERRNPNKNRQGGTWCVLAVVLLNISVLPVASKAEPVRPVSIYVIDGDTLDIEGQRFRLVGYDTPESYHAKCDFELALGNAAAKRVRDLLASGQLLDLVILPGRDRYDRGLARFSIGGKNLAEILIGEGLARAYQGGRRQSWC